MIRLEGVRLLAPGTGRGGRRALLDGAALSILFNEYVCLVGANGAGKSLLLQVLAGLRRPDEGTITFDNTNELRALVFQSPDDQIVGSTVERDLAFGLENRGVSPEEIRRRVAEALDWSGLTPLARRPPHLLSEGEKQRLCLTSVLILRPAVLLLDEPTGRLDPIGRRMFLEAVRRAREATGASVVQVTHRSEEVLRADRIVGMEHGRIVFDGSAAELVSSEWADRLGIVWSGLHRLRRALRARGVDAAGEPGPAWNDLEPLLARVRS